MASNRLTSPSGRAAAACGGGHLGAGAAPAGGVPVAYSTTWSGTGTIIVQGERLKGASLDADDLNLLLDAERFANAGTWVAGTGVVGPGGGAPGADPSVPDPCEELERATAAARDAQQVAQDNYNWCVSNLFRERWPCTSYKSALDEAIARYRAEFQACQSAGCTQC